MLYQRKPKHIYLCAAPVDFRKQINGLCAVIEAEFDKPVFAQAWFVFVSSDRKKIKMVYWRGAGVAMWQYRLEEQHFCLGVPRLIKTKSIEWKELRKFINGLNIFEGEEHAQINVKRYS